MGDQKKHTGGTPPLSEGEKPERFTVMVSRALLQEFKDEANRAEIAFSSAVRLAMREWIDNRQDSRPRLPRRRS
jgi:predicted DNA-binding ribbon-helix-helix protein